MSSILSKAAATAAVFLGVGCITAIHAGDDFLVPQSPAPPQPDFCFDQSLRSVDVFAGYNFVTDGETADDGVIAGVGANFFINRYIGFGPQIFYWDSSDEVLATGTSLILRYPIDSICLAPYAFGGGGFYFGNSADNPYWFVGAGLEYKFTQFLSLFGDARYVWSDDDDSTLVRSGLRISF